MDWPRTPWRTAAHAEPPPGGRTRHARSALHSARDVKSGHACRVLGRDIPPVHPVRRQRGGAVSSTAPGNREPA